MRRFLDWWLGLNPNFTGPIIAAFVGLFFFGQQLEASVWPVLQPPPHVSRVTIVGDRLHWHLDFCKRRSLRLEGSGFTFFYGNAPNKIGVPINAVNESRGEPVSEDPLPTGCFDIAYSVLLPKDAQPGDEVQGEVWYRSFHPLWLVRQDFGAVQVP